MKRLMFFLVVLTTASLWGADDLKPAGEMSKSGVVKNFDNRSKKAIEDMKGEQKKVDLTDPRNLNDGKMPAGLGDKGGATGVSLISTNSNQNGVVLPGGLGDKDGGKNANVINPVHRDNNVVGHDPGKVITPNKKGTDIENDYKIVQKITASMMKLFSGELRVGATHTRQDGAILNDFVGAFHLNIEDQFGATGYQIRVGTMQQNAPGYLWYSFSDLSGDQLGILSAHLTYDCKQFHLKLGRMINPIDETGYFIAPSVPLDGLYFAYDGVVKEETMFVYFTGQNDWSRAGDADNNFMLALKVSAALEGAKLALNYYWLHGDSLINYFGSSSLQGRFLQEDQVVANSTFKVDNHYITVMMGYDFKPAADQKLSFFVEGGLNLSIEEENWGLLAGVDYSYNKLFASGSFHYRRQNSVPTPFTDQFLTTDTLGGLFQVGYSLNKHSDVVLEGIFTDTISGVLEPKTVITAFYRVKF